MEIQCIIGAILICVLVIVHYWVDYIFTWQLGVWVDQGVCGVVG